MHPHEVMKYCNKQALFCIVVYLGGAVRYSMSNSVGITCATLCIYTQIQHASGVSTCEVGTGGATTGDYC